MDAADHDLSVDRARAALAVQIDEAFERWRHRSDLTTYQLTGISVPIEAINPYDWMAVQTAETQVLWHGRDDGICIAGIGKADVVVGGEGDGYDHILARCRRFLEQAPSVRYFGGFAFQPASFDDDRWYGFGPSRFILPRFELVSQPERTELRCNLLFRHDLG